YCDFLLVCASAFFSSSFFLHAPATTEIYTLSLHDALPIWCAFHRWRTRCAGVLGDGQIVAELSGISVEWRLVWPAQAVLVSFLRSEEHTSELQSRENLVCRLLLEKKKTKSELER